MALAGLAGLAWPRLTWLACWSYFRSVPGGYLGLPWTASRRFWVPFGLPREGPGFPRGSKTGNFGEKAVRAHRFFPIFAQKLQIRRKRENRCFT